MEYNSPINQRIKGKFTEREIIMLGSDIIRELSNTNADWFYNFMDESVNYYPVNEEGERDEDNGEYPEVYEWWFITEYLAKKLEDKGEIVNYYFNTPLWGRRTTGQAISLDFVTSKICEEMEILEGQKYEWRVN